MNNNKNKTQWQKTIAGQVTTIDLNSHASDAGCTEQSKLKTVGCGGGLITVN